MVSFVVAFLILFAALLLVVEIGYRLAGSGSPEASGNFESASIIDGYIMTLLGLLLAFGFNSARDDFNRRNELILSEAHAIRSAQLIFEGLEPEKREPCLALLSKYLDARQGYSQLVHKPVEAIEIYRNGRTLLSEMSRKLRSKKDTRSLSDEARDAIRAVESMEEVAVSRHILVFGRRHNIVLILLISFSLVAGVLIGIGLKLPRVAQRWHRIIFATLTAAVLTMILDYANPRAGLIRVDAADQALVELRS